MRDHLATKRSRSLIDVIEAGVRSGRSPVHSEPVPDSISVIEASRVGGWPAERGNLHAQLVVSRAAGSLANSTHVIPTLRECRSSICSAAVSSLKAQGVESLVRNSPSVLLPIHSE